MRLMQAAVVVGMEGKRVGGFGQEGAMRLANVEPRALHPDVAGDVRRETANNKHTHPAHPCHRRKSVSPIATSLVPATAIQTDILGLTLHRIVQVTGRLQR